MVEMDVSHEDVKQLVNVSAAGAHHAALMNPDLWSTLPRELLQCIFARLPLPQIISLRRLSKEWMRNVMSAEGDPGGFMRVCIETNPRMFGLIYQYLIAGVGHKGMFGVALCDVRSNEWYKFAIDTPYTEHSFTTMCASDGGLVCVISRMRDPVKDKRFKGPLVIIVCNPLTRQWRALPPHSLRPDQPLMVQLVMNRTTKDYEVMLVYRKTKHREGGHGRAKIYCSATREWRSAKSSSSSTTFLGYMYACEFRDHSPLLYGLLHRSYPCVYDGVQFQALDPSRIEDASVLGHALVEDRLFVLHKDMGEKKRTSGAEDDHQQRYFMSEFQGPKCKRNWVRVKVHSLTDLKNCLQRDHYKYGDLHGCKGFLFVTFINCPSCGLAQVYDLSTGKWHVITEMPKLQDGSVGDGGICELQWDAVP